VALLVKKAGISEPFEGFDRSQECSIGGKHLLTLLLKTMDLSLDLIEP